jgi:hypothetical protein
MARKKSSRVAMERFPPLAEPSTTVVLRPETVAVHTTHAPTGGRSMKSARERMDMIAA